MRPIILGVIASLAVLAGCASPAVQASTTENFVNLCELSANPEPYLGQEVATRGILVGLGSHGVHTYLPECPDIYQIVSVADGAPDSVLQTFQFVNLFTGDPTDQVYSFTVKPEIRRVRLSGTSSSGDRLILFLTDIKPKHIYR